MTKKITLRKWKSFLEDRGVEQQLLDEYLSYIQELTDKEIPVIFELEHLSRLVGINYISLCEMINSPESFYREFKIPKKRGGRRVLNAPYPSLLTCQKWIYKNILIKSPIHQCAQGFVENRSIFTNAEPHLNNMALLKMDLENFFPSIPINWVINYFSSLGYAKNVSFYLAALCCYHKHLPQGAATSPYLSNILLYSLDSRIQKLANAYNLIYTRYADDLTFSGNYIPHNFSRIVGDIVNGFNLSVNDNKTRLHTTRGQRIVTGISVAGESLALPRTKKRELRKEVHFIRKYGLLSHMSKTKVKNPSYLESLEGKLRFWLQVEPESKFAKSSISYINSLRNSISR